MSQLLGNVQAGWEETTLVSLSSIYTLFVGWLESACLSSNLITLFHFLISKVAESQGYLNISNLNVTKKISFSRAQIIIGLISAALSCPVLAPSQGEKWVRGRGAGSYSRTAAGNQAYDYKDFQETGLDAEATSFPAE